MNPSAARRKLDFRTWDELIAEVRRLHRERYHRLGTWDLGQMCVHLTLPIHGSLDGMVFKTSWLKRAVTGRIAKRVVLGRRSLPTGVKAPDIAIPPSSVDAASAIQELVAAIDRFRSHKGTTGMHPVFGRLTLDEWAQFHLIHAAHHLSYLVPVRAT